MNQNKSKIVNLKQKYVDYLGFKIKAVSKGTTKNGYVAATHISDEALKKIKTELKSKIMNIQRNTYSDRACNNYNYSLMTIKNYYKYATMVYFDLDSIARGLSKSIKIRLGNKAKIVEYKSLDNSYKKLNVGVKSWTKIYKVNDVSLYVIQAVHHKNPMNYRQSMSIYSVKGRCAISVKNK